jgi:ParB-like chromosome segregation protein Spo0J
MRARVDHLSNPHLKPVQKYACPEIAATVRQKFIIKLAEHVKKYGQLMPLIVNSRNEILPTGGRYLFEAIKLAGFQYCQIVYRYISDDQLKQLKELYP